MALIIRDDDLSFWTSPDEIENIYKPLFDKKIKISFATIPFAVKMYNPGDFQTFYQDENTSTPIGQNKEIVEYILEKINDGLIEIMLHGYNHLYNFTTKGQKIQPASKENLTPYREQKKNITFVGEYNYQTYENLYEKTKEGKSYLEDLFKIKIKNFVPPSNQINKHGIHAIKDNHLNLSGIIGKNYNREINLKGLACYTERILFSLKNREFVYPKIADYKYHKELVGYGLTPSTNMYSYYRQLNFCKENKFPFQIATHYWELKGQLLEQLYQIVDHALILEIESKFLKEVL